MTFKRGKIECFGKPYRHVGWHANDRPKFVKKSHEDLAKELETVGREPTYDATGWYTGSVKKVEKMPLLTEGQTLPDHMLDAQQFSQTIMRGPSLMDKVMYPHQSGKSLISDRVEFGNPCSEIHLTQSVDRLHRKGPASSVFIFDGNGFKVMPKNADGTRQTVMGYPLYSGTASTIEVVNEHDEFYVKIKQHRCMMDCEVRFGPVKTTLSDLFDDGHWLEVIFNRGDIAVHCGERKSKVYLTDGTDRYKVYSTNWQDMQINGNEYGQYDLGVGFTGRENMMKTHSSARYPKPVIQERIVEKIIERDPFEVLAERYPRGKKKKFTMDTMVGNRTLGERLQDHFPDQS